MQPTRVAALTLLLATTASAAQEDLAFGVEELEHSYERIELHRGLDRLGLGPLENTPEHNPVTDRGALLGRFLFYDTKLSANEKTSCASCHVQENAFADPRALSRGFEGRKTGRNSMGLANVAYYETGRFFWDERGATLEQMVLMPIQDKIEMGMGLRELVERLEADPDYRWLFWNAFGDPNVTADRVAFALAQFLRSMVSLNSRFDEGYAMTGAVERDFPNFTEQENLGKRVFFGFHDGDSASSCASCHVRDFTVDQSEATAQAPQAPGTQPLTPAPTLPLPQPMTPGAHPQTQQEKKTEVLAVSSAPRRPTPVLFQGADSTNNGLDRGRRSDDGGLGKATGVQSDVGKFKAPSLRNIALTGPYMHDGRFDSLSGVIEHYSNGIKQHRNLDPRLRRGTNGWRSRTPPRPRTPPVTPRPGRRAGRGPIPVTPANGGTRTVADVVQSRRRFDERGFNFTVKEKKALHAFLLTLTDEQFITDPKYSNPFIE